MSVKKPAKKPAAKTPTTRRTVKLDPEKVAAAEESMKRTQAIVENAGTAAEGEIVAQPPTPDQPAQMDQKPAEGSELVHSPSREAALSIVGGVTTEQLKAALTVQTEQRQLIQLFIHDNLTEGIDYGKIHVVKNCPNETRQAGSCDKDYHFSKSILMKPGQEKIFSLFGITDEISKDLEAYEMLGEVNGLVAYKCVMWRGDKRIGEGRGAALLGSERSDPNSTIKKAEKRARMDACLSLGFSAYFTQDLDDPEYAAQREMMNSKAAAEAERKDKDDLGLWIRDIAAPIDDEERQKLFAMIKAVGYERPDSMLDLLQANGVADPKAMTSGQARGFMRKLRDGQYTPVAVQVSAPPDHVVEDIGDEPLHMDDMPDLPPEEPQGPPPTPPAEIIVDDEFKAEIMDQFTSIGLNGRGEMWFKQYTLGRPFGKWESLTDKEWRKTYDVIQDILDLRLEVKESYIKGLVDPNPPVLAPDPNEVVHQVFPGAQVVDPSEPRKTQE